MRNDMEFYWELLHHCDVHNDKAAGITVRRRGEAYRGEVYGYACTKECASTQALVAHRVSKSSEGAL